MASQTTRTINLSSVFSVLYSSDNETPEEARKTKMMSALLNLGDFYVSMETSRFFDVLEQGGVDPDTMKLLRLIFEEKETQDLQEALILSIKKGGFNIKQLRLIFEEKEKETQDLQEALILSIKKGGFNIKLPGLIFEEKETQDKPVASTLDVVKNDHETKKPHP